MSDRQPRPWSAEGGEPDPRWSLANERTLLAYERTALGLVVAGFAVAGSHTFGEVPVWLAITGLPLIILGAAVGLEGRARFLSAQQAILRGEDVDTPRAVTFLPWGIAAVAVVGLVLAVIQLIAD